MVHSKIPLTLNAGLRWVILAAALLESLAGCVSANLGDAYVADQHGVVEAASAKLVVYATDSVDPGIVYYLIIDGERVGRVFQGTFFTQLVDPGFRVVVAEEYWTGKGFGKASSPANIFTLEEPDVGLPESLNVGAKTQENLQVSSGEVVYLQLTKAEGEEFFYTCDDTADTTTMCRGVRFNSAFEVVTEEAARQQLIGRRESL